MAFVRRRRDLHLRRGRQARAVRFIEHLKVFSFLANVGDSKLLAVHPATVTHSLLGEVAPARSRRQTRADPRLDRHRGSRRLALGYRAGAGKVRLNPCLHPGLSPVLCAFEAHRASLCHAPSSQFRLGSATASSGRPSRGIGLCGQNGKRCFERIDAEARVGPARSPLSVVPDKGGQPLVIRVGGIEWCFDVD